MCARALTRLSNIKPIYRGGFLSACCRALPTDICIVTQFKIQNARPTGRLIGRLPWQTYGTLVTSCIWLVRTTHSAPTRTHHTHTHARSRAREHNTKIILSFSVQIFFGFLFFSFGHLTSIRIDLGGSSKNFHISLVHKRLIFSASQSLPVKSQAKKFCAFVQFDLVSVCVRLPLSTTNSQFDFSRWNDKKFVSEHSETYVSSRLVAMAIVYSVICLLLFSKSVLHNTYPYIVSLHTGRTSGQLAKVQENRKANKHRSGSNKCPPHPYTHTHSDTHTRRQLQQNRRDNETESGIVTFNFRQFCMRIFMHSHGHDGQATTTTPTVIITNVFLAIYRTIWVFSEHFNELHKRNRCQMSMVRQCVHRSPPLSHTHARIRRLFGSHSDDF